MVKDYPCDKKTCRYYCEWEIDDYIEGSRITYEKPSMTICYLCKHFKGIDCYVE